MKMNKLWVILLIATMLSSSINIGFLQDVEALTPTNPDVRSDVVLGLNQPYGLSVDSKGDIYVADAYNNMIKKIDAKGLTVFAGGFDGKDTMGFPKGKFLDGLLTEARFNRPRDVYVSAQDIIYVADTGNQVIRKIEDGSVRTVAGNAVPGYVDGPANIAQFNMPSALAMDQVGNLYVADTLNNVIRVIDATGNTTTLALVADQTTLKQAELNEPSDLIFDAKGILYILDTGNQAIKRVDNGVISLVAGFAGDVDPLTGYVKGGLVNGAANLAEFNFPKGFAIDSVGNIYVSDSWNHMIRVITKDGMVRSFAGSSFLGNTVGPIASTRFNTPSGLVIKDNQLIVSDMWNNVIKSIPLGQSFVYTKAELMRQMDVSKVKTDAKEWSLWSNQIEIKLDKPIVKFEDQLYLPFKALMSHYGYKISWDAATRHVLYENGDDQDYVSTDKGMVIFNSNSYLSLKDFSAILQKEYLEVEGYKAIVEMELK